MLVWCFSINNMIHVWCNLIELTTGNIYESNHVNRISRNSSAGNLIVYMDFDQRLLVLSFYASLFCLATLLSRLHMSSQLKTLDENDWSVKKQIKYTGLKQRFNLYHFWKFKKSYQSAKLSKSRSQNLAKNCFSSFILYSKINLWISNFILWNSNFNLWNLEIRVWVSNINLWISDFILWISNFNL